MIEALAITEVAQSEGMRLGEIDGVDAGLIKRATRHLTAKTTLHDGLNINVG